MREDHEGQNETQNETLVYAADVFICGMRIHFKKQTFYLIYIYTSIRKFRIALASS